MIRRPPRSTLFPSTTLSRSVTAGVNYALSETNGPSGYSAGSWSCSGGGTQSGASITLGLAANVTCTINNNDTAPQLTLVKTVDRKSTRLNSSHLVISYAVFC